MKKSTIISLLTGIISYLVISAFGLPLFKTVIVIAIAVGGIIIAENVQTHEQNN